MSKVQKPVVVMTASGRVREHLHGVSIQQVLAAVYCEHLSAGSNWDRPARLFIGGECVVPQDLTEVAWEYGQFLRAKEDELHAALEDWVYQRFGGKPKSEAP